RQRQQHRWRGPWRSRKRARAPAELQADRHRARGEATEEEQPAGKPRTERTEGADGHTKRRVEGQTERQTEETEATGSHRETEQRRSRLRLETCSLRFSGSPRHPGPSALSISRPSISCVVSEAMVRLYRARTGRINGLWHLFPAARPTILFFVHSSCLRGCISAYRPYH